VLAKGSERVRESATLWERDIAAGLLKLWPGVLRRGRQAGRLAIWRETKKDDKFCLWCRRMSYLSSQRERESTASSTSPVKFGCTPAPGCIDRKLLFAGKYLSRRQGLIDGWCMCVVSSQLGGKCGRRRKILTPLWKLHTLYAWRISTQQKPFWANYRPLEEKQKRGVNLRRFTHTHTAALWTNFPGYTLCSLIM
jgi:hypothetical protein